ncbi:MAG: hypothetical protein KGZ49_00485 [Syntrophaceae bacterium]|nr:hypothetical protein [Syntrophaceae bacterium]
MTEVNISNDLYGRIAVSFPYDSSIITKIKTIEGRRWRPVEKYWTFPNRNGVLEKILKVFGDKEIQIDTALKTTTSKV